MHDTGDKHIAAAEDTGAMNNAADTGNVSYDDGDRRARVFWYYAIFVASGFAGLIYQSLWARYLKLFLGNAAAAQVLVLAVFLGGLAIGSALAARASVKLRHPLLLYAIIEAIIALAAVWFHDIFVAAESWATGFVLPRTETAAAAGLFRWSLSAALILPQSILLGATFPLMSAGLARMRPAQSGGIIANLYFANSIGAAAGALGSAFLLIPFVGLPGAGLFAGLLNAIAALGVWILGRRYDDTAPVINSLPESTAERGAVDKHSGALLLLIVAAGTGAASFVYEIVWVRMISLLVGSSTHAFEVMLSAFIAGIAIGALVVRRRAQSDAQPLMLLAKVQFVMGALALVSLFVYPHLFAAVSFVFGAVPRDGLGYGLYLLAGYGFAAVMMLPATICAGMTLPLLSKILMRTGGESALGAIYAANTAGGIVGAVVAVHFLLPVFGISLSLTAGAAVDLLLALVLARRAMPSATPFVAVGVCALVAPAVAFGAMDPRIVSSGVFRHGTARNDTGLPIFHRDGKTATISVFESRQGNYVQRNIMTNGKPDAALIYEDDDNFAYQTKDNYQTLAGYENKNGGDKSGGGESSAVIPHTGDEMTMSIAALLPLLLRPDAKSAANIGLGSGLTASALLTSPSLRRADTIEIEEMVARGAPFLGERVARAFSDTRSNIIIDDAKSYFARHRSQYDIIISEPSNPWISGVANLFSREFYRRIRDTLAPDGVFVQWTHFYESSPQLVASKMTALAESFSDFHWYLSGDSDLIVVAVAEGKVPPFSDAIFADDDARRFWNKYGYRSAADMNAIFIGDKKNLMPYLHSFAVPPNSDYFPYVEHRAPLDFFRRTFYSWPNTFLVPVPAWEMITGRPPADAPIGELPRSSLAAKARRSAQWFEEMEKQQWFADTAKLPCPIDDDGEAISPALATHYLRAVSGLMAELLPQAPADDMARFWQKFGKEQCAKRLLAADGIFGDYTRFWRALSLRDAEEIIQNAEALLPEADLRAPSGRVILLAIMAAHYKRGRGEDYQRVLTLANRLPRGDAAGEHLARFIAAHAAEKL
ncbi:MAG: fused MFS/spermidine synthase [Gammaproteobacteria bacterium]